MNKQIIDPDSNYSFSDYHRLNYPARVILKELGYSYTKKRLDFPLLEYENSRVESLKTELEFRINTIGLYSEDARKQLVISEILVELCKTLPIQLNIEYPINVNSKLKGVLDYYIEGNNFIVVEAKNADMDRGFTQLAIELIAVSESITSENSLLYGAVTTGSNWRFGVYNRLEKIIIEDDTGYEVPRELQKLMNIFMGILQ